MHADSCFFIGKTHSVCQDYTRSGMTSDGRPYIIVSDGCSRSPDSDIGARLMVLAMESRLQAITYQTDRVPDCLEASAVAWAAKAQAQAIGLSADTSKSNCLDATLLWACLTADRKHIRVEAHGDGVIAAKLRDGTFRFWYIEFEFPPPKGDDEYLGAPAYPSYLLNSARLETYLRQTRQAARVIAIPKEDTPDDVGPVSANRTGMCPDHFLFNVDKVESVFLMTDGARSFQQEVRTPTSRKVEPVSLSVIVSEVIRAQGEGRFLERRCRSFLQRTCVDKEWSHYDDFSAGAIYCGR